jgi:SMC interacting uncharacterized protein involved in chromosome segregation
MDKPKDLTFINAEMDRLHAQVEEKRLSVAENLSRMQQRGDELKQQINKITQQVD